jgi:hypothetical protein
MSYAASVTPLRPETGTNDLLKLLQSELDRIKFGSIHMSIHDGKVVQFDVTEKRRLT